MSRKELWRGLRYSPTNPILSGPSSPQRCSQPTVKHVPKRDGSAQWAVRVIFSSTRVLVLGL